MSIFVAVPVVVLAGAAIGVWCAIVTLLMPEPVRLARNTVLIAPITAVLIGLLALVIGAGLNALSYLLCTIPFILLADVLLIGLSAVGLAVIAEPIGHVILRRRGIYAAPIAAAAIGGFALMLIAVVLSNLPFGLSVIGTIFIGISVAAAIGGLILTRLGRRAYPPYKVV